MNAPIGVFDSGVGGLSVLREIRRALPHERLLYVADSLHAPYGERDEDFIATRADAIVDFLVAEGAKAIVIACNTATAVAVAALRSRHALPIVAIEPALKPAASLTQSGVVGVMATRQTLASDAFRRLAERHAPDVRLVLEPCPGLVEQIERGELNGAAAQARVAGLVKPMIEAGADVIVLGCTHFPFAAPLIRKAAGPGVEVLDPAVAVAAQLARRLDEAGLRADASSIGSEQFYTSGEREHVAAVIGALWGQAVPVAAAPL